jgi:hypothetical protein
LTHADPQTRLHLTPERLLVRTTITTCSTASSSSAASSGRTRRAETRLGSGRSRRGCRNTRMIAATRRRARMRWQILRRRGNGKKTAPVRARVCAVGGGNTSPGDRRLERTPISDDLAMRGTNKFSFILPSSWQPCDMRPAVGRRWRSSWRRGSASRDLRLPVADAFQGF